MKQFLSGEETDEKIYSAFLEERDESYFRILFERHRKSLILFLNGMVGNLEDAEELMIESFAIIASGTARYVARRDCSFKTWLFAIAGNRAKMLLRKKRPVFSELDENIETSVKLPEPELFEKEDSRQLYEALSDIAEDYRLALYLTFFEEMKPEEIGRVMKKNTKQVYNLTSRGKEALRNALQKRGFDYEKY